MAYDLPKSLSLESTIDYTGEVTTKLEALVEYPAPAEPWRGATTPEWQAQHRVQRQARDERDAAQRRIDNLSARCGLLRVLTGDALAHFAGMCRVASGHKITESPYSDLLGTVSPSEARKLGAEALAEFVQALAVKSKALAIPSLGEPLAALETVADRLGTLAAERDAAERDFGRFGVQRAALLEQTEALIERTEAELRKSFPRNDELVREILAPPRHQPKKAEPRAAGPEAQVQA